MVMRLKSRSETNNERWFGSSCVGCLVFVADAPRYINCTCFRVRGWSLTDKGLSEAMLKGLKIIYRRG